MALTERAGRGIIGPREVQASFRRTPGWLPRLRTWGSL
jgi:hypothetical protein